MNRPLLLLLATGAMLGLNFPLGKIAIGAGVEPALWAALISLGAGLALLIISSLARAIQSFEARRVPRLAPQDEGGNAKEARRYPSPTPPRKGEGSLLRY